MVRNDGLNSGRVRLWVLHSGGVITATPGETSDSSTFESQTWATNRDGKINGFYESIITGETGGYSNTPTDYGVTFSSDTSYWHDLLIKSPFEIVGGELQLAEGLTTASYIYDFDLAHEQSGELNYLFRATNIPAERLKVYDTQNTSVYDAQSLQITPEFEASPEKPLIEFFIDLERTGTYLPLTTSTAKRFELSSIKMQMRREAGSAYRPSVSFLQTTLSN